MKKILTLAVILGIAAAGAPYLAGRYTESHLHDKIDGALGQRAAAHLNLKLGLENYRRGYVSSTATLTVDAGDSIRRYPLDIRHAPLTLTGFDITRITVKHPAEAALPDGDLRVNLLRQLTYTQHIPAAEKDGEVFKGADITVNGPEQGFPLDNTLTLDLHGVKHGDSKLDPAHITLHYADSGLTLSSPALAYSDGLGTLNLHNPQASLPFITVNGKHLPARLEYRIGAGSLKDADGNIDLTLRDSGAIIGIEAESSAYNLTARLDSNFTIQGKLADESKILLPILPDRLNLDYTIKNLSAHSVETAAALFRQVPPPGGSDLAPSPAASAIDQMTHAMQPDNLLDETFDQRQRRAALAEQLRRDLLARDLGLHLAFDLSGTGKGIGLDIALAEHIKSEADLAALENSSKPPLAQYLHGSRLHAHIDRAILGGLLGQLLSADELEKMHFIAGDDLYTLDFAVNADGYQLNGKPLSDSELEALMLDLFRSAMNAGY